MMSTLLNLLCFLLLIRFNSVSARPLPRSCRAKPLSTSSSSISVTRTSIHVHTSTAVPALPTGRPSNTTRPSPTSSSRSSAPRPSSISVTRTSTHVHTSTAVPALPTGRPSNTTRPSPTPSSSSSAPRPSSVSNGCFPSLNFQMPSVVPDSLGNWWCSMDTEYAFMGFSYEVTACQSPSQLNADFADIRNNLNGRYVRLYGACDNSGFYDDVVDAAWNNGIGVHALIWFGFDGGNEWETRRDSLINTLTTNPKAKFVTRGVQFGSEPLYDNVLPHSNLASQVKSAQAQLAGVQIPVTVSELAYGYQERNAQDVLDAIDFINIHMLPFFSPLATTGSDAWSLVEADMNWFIQNGGGKKMYFDENGWPSVTSSSVQPNSPDAVASVSDEQQYYQLLDDHCTDLKNAAGGGIGWFAHIYSDNQEPGYGIYDENNALKFNFRPRTSC